MINVEISWQSIFQGMEIEFRNRLLKPTVRGKGSFLPSFDTDTAAAY